ncbi:MAG TPA: 50S ribosomal protein L44e [Nanoarchaeota archaeon]|nr:50S ribosomal protein L44e [Nanoarchaeota archaeon]
MKAPKVQNRYCPTCKKHTAQKVSVVKTKARPKTKITGLKRGVRHVGEIFMGYGGSPRKTVNVSKTTRKIALKFECPVCKKINLKHNPIRMKKFEQV